VFGSIGMQELIVIFVIALIVFGPRRLPEIGRTLGKSIAEFKRASEDLRNRFEEEVRVDEQRAAQQPTPAPVKDSEQSVTPHAADGGAPQA
jgi:sec-independent protein translocase protein TatA